MIKLIAIDLDGTLLPNNQLVPQRTVGVIRELVNRGIYVVIASGRTSQAAERIQRQLGIPGQPIIMLNGIMVSYKNEIRMVKGIPLDVMYDSFNFCNERGYNFSVVFGGRDLTVMNNDDEFSYDCHSRLNLATNIVTIKTVEDMMEISKFSDEVVKINILDSNPEIIERATREAIEVFGSRVNIMRAGPCFIDYSPLGTDKGTALQILTEALGLDRREIMAIGDSENDLNMLKVAGISVAVGNALDNIKEIADFVTDNDNENEGVREAIEKLVLSGF